jgi:hydrogenase maturation factor
MGKNEIDAEVIRRYFLIEHENAIRWRKQVKPELKLEECVVYPGRVMKIGNENVLVRTPLGERMFRKDFAESIKAKDWVSVHYDYISEKINEGYANRMRRLRHEK